MLHLPIHDDRDRAVRVHPVHAGRMVLASLAASLQDGAPQRGRRRIARLASLAVRCAPLWIGLMAGALIAMLAVLLIRDFAVGLSLLVISPVMAPMVTLGLVTGRGLLGLRGELPRRVRGASLTRGVCPGCRYELSRLPQEHDGCVTCPECGAAWRWDALTGRGGDEPEVVVIAAAR